MAHSFVRTGIAQHWVALLVALILSASPVIAEEPYQIEWIRQIGTEESTDIGQGVAVDAEGAIHITGYSAITGGTSEGFVNKYDAAGTLKWEDQFARNDRGFVDGISADGLGNVYITGSSLTKYNSDGTRLWMQPYRGDDVSADAMGNSYITATLGIEACELDSTSSSYIARHDTDGRNRHA